MIANHDAHHYYEIYKNDSSQILIKKRKVNSWRCYFNDVDYQILQSITKPSLNHRNLSASMIGIGQNVGFIQSIEYKVQC